MLSLALDADSVSGRPTHVPRTADVSMDSRLIRASVGPGGGRQRSGFDWDWMSPQLISRHVPKSRPALPLSLQKTTDVARAPAVEGATSSSTAECNPTLPILESQEDFSDDVVTLPTSIYVPPSPEHTDRIPDTLPLPEESLSDAWLLDGVPLVPDLTPGAPDTQPWHEEDPSCTWLAKGAWDNTADGVDSDGRAGILAGTATVLESTPPVPEEEQRVADTMASIEECSWETCPAAMAARDVIVMDTLPLMEEHASETVAEGAAMGRPAHASILVDQGPDEAFVAETLVDAVAETLVDVFAETLSEDSAKPRKHQFRAAEETASSQEGSRQRKFARLNSSSSVRIVDLD